MSPRTGGLPGLFRTGLGRGGVGRRRGGGSLVVTVVIVLGLYFLGVDPSLLLDGGLPSGQVGGAGGPVEPRSPEQAQLADFVSVVLADTEDTWHVLFAQQGQSYEEPVLVLFSGLVQSACGTAQAAMGPFYCPLDQKVYIDLDFYQDLKRRHGAPGDFAQAYVIAHEVGHHVQKQLGISDEVQARRRRLGEVEANRLSVRLELQADCFAGVWGHHADRTRQLLEDGDVEEALQAASSIGDDRLQKQARGYAVPESFTHGSSEQRVRWFRKGIASGRLQDCNTFEVAEL
jgi:predicted metalloprotease